MKKYIHLIFAILFLITISFPFWGMIFSREDSTSEKRELLRFDEITELEMLGKYIEDNHACRNILSKIHFMFYLHLLKESPTPGNVQLGKDGWLFLGDRHNDIYSRSLGIRTFHEEDIERICENVGKIKAFCDSIHTDFYFVICPNKETIYPEYLLLKPNSTKRLREYIHESLYQNYGISTIDLTDCLLKEKTNAHLFYKTDTHWNKYGAFIGAKEIFRNISQSNNTIQPLREEYFLITENRNTFLSDLAELLKTSVKNDYEYRLSYVLPMQIEEKILEQTSPTPELIHIKNHAYENKNKVFIFKDSFFRNLAFPMVTNLHEAYIYNTDYIFDSKKILEQIKQTGKPDLILFISVERNLDNIRYKESS